MKNLFIFLIYLLIVTSSNAQDKFFDYSGDLSCADVVNGIVDSKLYFKRDGKIFVIESYDRNKIYKVTTKTKSYYISSELKQLIETTMKDNDCNGVSIISIFKDQKKPRPKIVRD